MTDKKIYQKWAPIGTRWVEWVRPVPFMAINEALSINVVSNFTIPQVNYLSKVLTDTAVIIDMPSFEGIEEGLAMAKLGFRPIPLYNGTKGQDKAMTLVDTKGIAKALIWGAFELDKVTISSVAPPAFLLDSNRMHQYKMNASIFDNSWDLYHQDLPSAEYFLNHGINKIVVRGEKVQEDLAKIFYKFQAKGITIFLTDGFEKPHKVIIKRGRKTDDL